MRSLAIPAAVAVALAAAHAVRARPDLLATVAAALPPGEIRTGVERARELAGESHAKARAALSEAEGRTQKLEGIADYILTRPV